MTDEELAGQDEGTEPAQVEADEAPASQARLILKRAGAETDEQFPLHPPSTIGRFDPAVGPIDVDLGSIPEGVYVSRKHARITNQDGSWSIEDLGSSNGTFLLRGDFERVEQAEIADGDEIAFGNARFVFRLDGAVESMEDSPEAAEDTESPTEA